MGVNVMQAILKQNFAVEQSREPASIKKIGILGALFGCWHKRLTRPFTERGSSYRACLESGARRKFDPQTFKTTGSYYFPVR